MIKYVIVTYSVKTPLFFKGFCTRTAEPQWSDNKEESMLYDELWEVGTAIKRVFDDKAFVVKVEVPE